MEKKRPPTKRRREKMKRLWWKQNVGVSHLPLSLAVVTIQWRQQQQQKHAITYHISK